MRIIDCFTFYNELELLMYRLNILNDVVDYFIIVEATHTFAGNPKELIFQKNKDMFKQFEEKIIHVVVNDFTYIFPNIDYSKNQQWVNENYQRICIKNGLDKLELQDDDVITITDLDEIPNPTILLNIKNKLINITINILVMDFYYYNLNSKLLIKWYHPKIVTYKKYKDLAITCEGIRQYNNCEHITNGGWHLSYFGNSTFIKNKIQQFAHCELNTESNTTIENIERRVNNTVMVFDELNDKIQYIPISENNHLPPKYNEFLQKFIRS